MFSRQVNLINAFDQSLNLFLTRVAGAPGAYQSFRLQIQTLHYRRRIEVAMRDEYTSFGQRDSNGF